MSPRRRPVIMRPSSLLLGMILLALALAPFPQPSASASCAAPYLEETEGRVLTRGTTVTIEGRAFVDGCRDLGSCSIGTGCEDDSCDYGPEPEPLQGVTLRLVQDGRAWMLGTTDAGSSEDDELGWVSWTVEVPADAKPGPATLVADPATPLRFRIR